MQVVYAILKHRFTRGSFFMVVIPREICRDLNSAFAYEWIVRNGRGAYAAASIGGALTRRQHGLLVVPPTESAKPHVMLAKLDEEVEVERHVYKLGTNEYQSNVVNPDGFLYLQQVTLEGALATFAYEAGRFQLTKSVWMEPERACTYIHYRLSENSASAQLTLVPMCDYRASDAVTHGAESWRFQVRTLDKGFVVTAHDGALAYRLISSENMTYTPLDLWYWRFQLRKDAYESTDIFVPGLLRATLEPGTDLMLMVTSEPNATLDCDVEQSMSAARRAANVLSDSALETFSPVLYAPAE